MVIRSLILSSGSSRQLVAVMSYRRGRGRRGGGHSQKWDHREGSRRGSSHRPPYAFGLGDRSRTEFEDEEAGNFNLDNRFSRHGPHSSQQSSYDEDDSSSSNRPPRHLRGKEIGLWYAARSRGKTKERRQMEEKRDRHEVQMNARQERDLSSLLASIQSTESIRPQPERSYTMPSDSSASQDWWNAPTQSGSSSTTSVQHPPAHRHEAAFDADQPSTSRTYTSSTASGNFSVTTSFAADDRKEDSDDSFDSDDDEICLAAASQVEQSSTGSAALDFIPLPESDDEAEAEDDKDFVNLYNFQDNEESESQFMFEFKKHRAANRRSNERLNEIGKVRALIKDHAMDQKYKEDLAQKQTKKQYLKMLEFRKKLPSYSKQEDLLEVVHSSQVVVISGETGCGKTTQVPQFILDDYINKGQGSMCRIVCTQPRRISAISVAERVAAERCEPCGEGGSVGYQIRLEKKLPRSRGSMLFCTTGILLQWLASDPYLSDTTHVVLDEIHERDLHSDFLMIVLRDLLPARPDLKVILMSATLNAHLFSQYYGECPMLHIPGFTFPVQEFLLEDIIEQLRWRWTDPPVYQSRRGRTREQRAKLQEQRVEFMHWCRSNSDKYSNDTLAVLKGMDFEEIQIDLISDLVEHIICAKPEGAILVFVPGWEQISKLVKLLEAKDCMKYGKSLLLPLHSLMPTVNQKEVFDRPPPGVRKVIVATNIAETSITIDDVVYVVDCGKIKMKNYNAEENLATLQPEWVSHANARQRRGRAGRVQPGECYHLYTAYQSTQFADYQLPELLRTRLEELCLQVKLLRLGKIQPFLEKAMQPPAHAALMHSIQLLRDLNALDENEDLTPLGYHLAKMPLDPQTGKMILFSAMFCCLDPILTIAASLSFKNAFYIPMGKEAIADKKRKELAGSTRSDHMMLANAYTGWERACARGTNWHYCRENFLAEHTLRLLRDMRKQFATLLHEMGFITSGNCKEGASNVNSGNEQLVRAVICAGLYPNVVKYRSKKLPHSKQARFRPGKMTSKTESRGLMFHPKSVNDKESDFASIWFVYHLKLKSTKIFIHDATMVMPYSILFFGGQFIQKSDGADNLLVVDDWMQFKASSTVVDLIQQLRHQLDQLLESKVTRPAPTNWNQQGKEGALLNAIIQLVTQEESCVPAMPDKRDKYRHSAKWKEQGQMKYEQKDY